MNFLWSLLGALLPAAAGMLVLVIGSFCSLFPLDANSQMGPGIGLIFVAAAIRLLDRKKRLMSAPRPYPRKTFCKSTCICINGPGACPRGFLLCPNAC